MTIPPIDLKLQYASIKSEIDAAVAECFAQQSFILGPIVEGFEADAAKYLGVKHAIGINSGSDALLLCLWAAGIKPGDEVIVPAWTFFATAGAVHRLGAKPVFCDVHEDTFNIDVADAARRVTKATRAIMPVDLYGQCADMDAVLDLARSHGLLVIEDAAQAFGATRHGRQAGTLGQCGVYSFYPTKNLGGAGDGGMVVTNDDALADRVKLLHTHGERPRYHNKEVGMCGRLDALQAAVLRVKLRHLDAWNARRAEIARQYDALLAGAGLKLPSVSAGNVHIYHQYTIRVNGGGARRDKLQQALKDQGVGSTIYYPVPLHRQECFAYTRSPALPVSEHLAQSVLSLPMFPELTNAQVKQVAAAVLSAL